MALAVVTAVVAGNHYRIEEIHTHTLTHRLTEKNERKSARETKKRDKDASVSTARNYRYRRTCTVAAPSKHFDCAGPGGSVPLNCLCFYRPFPHVSDRSSSVHICSHSNRIVQQVHTIHSTCLRCVSMKPRALKADCEELNWS